MLTSVGQSLSQPPAPVPQSERAITRFPSQIPLKGRDVSYSEKHPGWERYLSESLEYLVLHDASNIKGYQVISRKAEGVSENQLTAFLLDAVGDKFYAIKQRQIQGDFVMESGQIAEKGEIVIYRKQPSGPIRAFVISTAK